jgi:hypothetical protein
MHYKSGINMITTLNVVIEKTEPTERYHEVTSRQLRKGEETGRKKLGDSWEQRLYPSSEKLRIWKEPKILENTLYLDVVPFQWSDLQRYRQIQPVDSDEPYLDNAIALTANAVLRSSDNKFIFHIKKGGAKEGSVHTFGGYVLPTDNDIRASISRELTENSEIGLQITEFHINDLFGTSKGMPSILWDYGTGAIYADVTTSLSSSDLQDRMYNISSEESLKKELVITDSLYLRNYHPQTASVMETMLAKY